jgi:hypothetical protein
MAEKIEESERRSLAAVEVDEALETPSLEKEFMRLEAGTGTEGVEDRLLALKREMGFLGAGEDEEPKQLGSGADEADAEGEADETESGAEAADADGRIREAKVEFENDDSARGDKVAETELLAEFERLERTD